MKASFTALIGSLLFASASYAQNLPDWSGAWQMVGPTVFDTATQTGKGGAIDPGVREHPPYTLEWEALYQKNLDRRDKNMFPDVFTNCGVPAGYPRIFNLPDPYEFVVRPEEFWILSENGPNVMRVYTDGRKLQKSKGPDYEEIAAKWDGNKLVTDEVGAHKGKISRTFEVSSDGHQLIETVHVADSKGNHPVNVQYVYDAIDEREFNR